MSRALRIATITAASAAVVIITVKMTTSTTLARSESAAPQAPVAAVHDAQDHRSGPTATATAVTPTAPAVPTASAPAVPAIDPIGRVQPVPESTNAQVALVAAAIRSGDHPERLSAMVQPPPFVTGSDAHAYAAEVAPGRAFQSAQPGPGVPVLGAVGPTQLTMDQDGQVYLRARSEPGSPVTFTSFDLGHFGNSLATQTVVADANGVASVAFSAGPGTIDAVHVLAGSPVASGQVAYDITVAPAGAGTRASGATSAPVRSGI